MAQQAPNLVAISSSRLPAAFDGLRIAVVADLHASPRRGGIAAVRRMVEAVNSARPDMIVLLGDMAHRGRDASGLLGPLSDLQAREGVYACLGNHEHGFAWHSRYIGPAATHTIEEWRGLYADLGVELLVNEARSLSREQARIWLVAVDDPYSGNDDLARALAGVADGGFRLAITHSPDLLDNPRAGELDLILAGHTHGGQIWIPWVGPIWAPCRKPRQRASGLIRNGSALAYVTRGVGEGLPIRIACPREMPVIELRSGPEAPIN